MREKTCSPGTGITRPASTSAMRWRISVSQASPRSDPSRLAVSASTSSARSRGASCRAASSNRAASIIGQSIADWKRAAARIAAPCLGSRGPPNVPGLSSAGRARRDPASASSRCWAALAMHASCEVLAGDCVGCSTREGRARIRVRGDLSVERRKRMARRR